MARLPDALAAHFHADRHVGPPPDRHPDARLGRGEARHPACGDHVVVWLALREGRVDAAGFKAVGCPAALATAAAVCGVAAGLPADADLDAALTAAFTAACGAPAPAHRHALALVLRAVDAARHDVG